jgi:hypothetical protein
MNLRIFSLGLCLLCCCLAPLRAADAAALNVRMVQASNQKQPSDPRLQDVQAFLAENTPFTQFSVVDQADMAVAKGTVNLAQGFVLEFTPQGEQMAVRITQGGKEKLKALVTLQAKVPLCLGGFPSGNGKIIFVVIAR